jgi:K+-transporting ATPase A subunit
MKTNMGATDRILRVLIAIAIAVLYLTGVLSGTLGIVLLVLAGVFVVTSAVGTCPLYTLVRIDTCKR